MAVVSLQLQRCLCNYCGKSCFSALQILVNFNHFNLKLSSGLFTVVIRVHFYILCFCFVQDAISSAFDAAWQYAGTFEPYRQFYQENESLDLEAIRSEEHGIHSLK